jgi:hypothetical protein
MTYIYARIIGDYMDVDEKLKVLYDKFLVKINEFQNLDVSLWNSNHLLGYYCSKYKEYYKIDYQFKYDKNPSQSHELKMIGILKLIISSEPQVIKDYIDFYFETRVKNSKRKLSIASLRAEFLLEKFKNTYQIKQSSQNIIPRATQLPNNVLGIMLKNKLQARTYGDLVFLLSCNDSIKSQLDEIRFDYKSIQDRVV